LSSKWNYNIETFEKESKERHLPAANWLDNDARMHAWENASFDGNLLYDKWEDNSKDNCFKKRVNLELFGQ